MEWAYEINTEGELFKMHLLADILVTMNCELEEITYFQVKFIFSGEHFIIYSTGGWGQLYITRLRYYEGGTYSGNFTKLGVQRLSKIPEKCRKLIRMENDT